ncbi:Orf3/QacEdelta1 fusion protein [Oceaniovalibus guishaninsula JLT2003]|uniref:Orf3/QacEdelta1 fusion protein n=1 Tax=Oceaniovalibus guishaninsula JLT2003 TaxID=1231392 RepID=K2I5A2_9RHOB|nr:SMR family transporter [Oceaniovalibus guishaninsula]EKE44085.1 Orf3/QacEdelta1 fusion protein [Oceaniovalibus guishaninsula JLT2003]
MRATYIQLAVAILAEVIATTALAASDGFTRKGPAAVTVLGYGVAFYLLSLTLRVLPTGVVYAVWSGLGVVAVTALSWALGQRLDGAAFVGLALIVAGVVVLNVWSDTLPR